ncbi:SusC/RagA family TonB-linked outer membrane protein [Pinibacter soli]|uniref:SusC/RagA family TonB-linked outer membrane protein n=1 Tax=Pinibacter soli TaxID=3044211 RepID=A0ABT6RFZ6_9BACT|nr:SusC/RagA family TonB-linked outer membrane protein [Pinibacter soli]MDI3321485.1 SusC/RagA family TonB-linked outer membrane protein [Pinibacter soli]
MIRLLFGSLFYSLCIFCFSKTVAGETGSHFTKDSIPSRIIPKLRITVKDMADGLPIDSALVIAGYKKGYTNANGYIEFDSISKETIITAVVDRYFSLSKTAKPSLTLRLARKEYSFANTYSNGLYERPLEHFSGAATIVDGVELRRLNPVNFADALKICAPSFLVTRGNDNGDDPNITPSTNIRGLYNFPASASVVLYPGGNNTNLQLNPSVGDFVAGNVANPNQPVVLLDGVQVSLQTVLDMDINRISQVVILKDAAATAVYGVRGGTGVLLVKTKKPEKGMFNVTYSGQVQIATPDLSSYHLMNAADKLQLEQTSGFWGDNAALAQKRQAFAQSGRNTNWLAIPTRTGVGSKHYLTVGGGDDDLSYGMDFSYNDVEGVMKGSKRQNINIGGYVGTRIKNFTVNNYLRYTTTNAFNSPYGTLAEYAGLNAFWNPYDSITGKFAKVLDEYRYKGDSVRIYNPAYNGILSTTDKGKYTRFSDQLSLSLNIGRGFKADGYISLSKQADVTDVFLPPGHTAFANYTPELFFLRGMYNQVSSDFSSMEGGLNLNYTKRVNLHQFYGSAGIMAMQTRSESAGISLVGFTSDKLSALSFGNSYLTSKPQASLILTRLASAYGNFTYSYDNRYQLEVTGHADQSSQFPQNVTEPYWSVGASWNLHQERFFHANKFVSILRVRGSVGTTGNQFYQSYLSHSTYDYYTDRQYIQGSTGYTNVGIGQGAYLTAYANNALKVPQTEKQNIGLEAMLFKDRLSIMIDAYKNKSSNIILPVSSPASTGFMNFSYYDNLGAIESKGVEFALNYRVINNIKKGVTWSVSLNGIHNENRVAAISNYIDGLNTNKAVDNTVPQPNYVVGQSLTGIWAVRSLGIDPATGQEKFLKADGTQTFTWNAADRVLAGDLNPKWRGSFGTSISVKSISAGVYFSYQLGASYYNQTLADYVENADISYNVDERAANNRWTKPGDVALYKALSVNGLVTSPTYATTRFVEKNNSIECAAISLGYKLAEKISSKIGAKNTMFGFIANNVFQSSTMKAQRGIYYPFQHTYTFSITTSF